ncbi:MAG: hypothetical protein J0I07_31835 [Myxococcales bacterium]|nr:hypothetical protein [Myxococcales bacterium]
MRKKWLLAMATATVFFEAALLVACANDGDTSATPPEEESQLPVPAPPEGGAAPTEDEDAGLCTKDCEYFVDDCTDDVLCNSGPFASTFEGGPLDPRTHIRALSGRSANDVWLAGTVGTVAKFDGTAWRRSATETQQSFYALWLRPDAEIAFDDPSRLYVRGIGNPASTSTGGWWLYGTATMDPGWRSAGMRLVSAWAHPDGQSLWIGASTGGISETGLWRMRYADDSFRVDPVASGQCYALPCLYITTYDGLSPNEVWAVGPQGAALRIQNAEEETPTITGYNTQTSYALNDVWVRASDDVWAVGSTGTIRRYRGDARLWEVYSHLGTTQHLNAIVGSSANDIWIAGDDATVFHFDGTEWKRLKVAGLGRRRPNLERIWRSSTGQVWIAGQGALLSLGGKP